MDAYLADETSCSMLRLVRRSPMMHAEEISARMPSDDDGARVQWWRDVIRALEQCIDVNERHPLHVLVSAPEHRVRSRLVRSSVCTGVLPRGSYLAVQMQGSDAILAIETPAHSFHSLARALSHAIREKRLTYPQARGLLLAYGYELCGTYVKDPQSPNAGETMYGLRCAAMPEELATWCEACSRPGVRTVTLANQCAQEVLAGSASPGETVHGIVLTSRPELGGLGFRNVSMNDPCDPPLEARKLMHRLPLTPDLKFEDWGLVLEHQGGYHGQLQQYREDASRVQDYGALGYDVFMTSANDLESPAAYDAFLGRLVSWIRCEHGQEAAAPYQAVLDDPELTRTRYDLVSVLIDKIHDPWNW